MHSLPRSVLIALIAATSLVLAGTAPLARADGISHPAVATQRAMATAEQIALQTWGTAACGGQVTITWTALAPQVNATSSWTSAGDPYSAPAENTACHVAFNRLANWDWPKLCTVVVHELGHLTGHRHSSDPSDVMAPFYTKPLRACDTPGPDQPAGTSAAASKTTATTTPATTKAATLKRHAAKAPKATTVRRKTKRSTKRHARIRARRPGAERRRGSRPDPRHRRHTGHGA